MDCYRLEGDTYIIENFDRQPTFSSFLPGLAGIKGIPIWVYYTNRGQGINSFGIHNKDNAIMEFNPANTAYENTPIKGFRTFIKCDGQYFEPFRDLDDQVKRTLYIRKNSFAIEEVNKRHNISIKVNYTVLPEESIGALVRNVEIKNIGDSTRQLEVLDGLPKIIPYGISNSAYKEMSNLLKSWSDIKNIEESQSRVPYYTMRSSSDDSSEVSEIDGGYFYLTVNDNKLQPVIYDPDIVFEYDNSLINPIGFMGQELGEFLEKKQCFYNKIPCGFTPQDFTLKPMDTYQFYTLTGFAASPEQINEKLESICAKGYLNEKEELADRIVSDLTKDIRTESGMPVFDKYMEQCYLDNFLRGGYPYIFNKDTNKSVVHLFSRKHGDPERDYNFFAIAGEYYSQGNGNFRDVNQNRRNDIFFNKDIGDFNIKTFFQLVQIDGYNPLEVRPSTFSVKEDCREEVNALINDNISENREAIVKILEDSFTPGQIANRIAKHHIEVACGEDEFLKKLLECCHQNIEAGFGEGYWSDHWDYNMDLVESYLKVFPDRKEDLLFGDNTYRFYDSPARVMPRSEKYVLNSKNEVRQYGSLVEDEEKINQEGFNEKGSNWLKNEDGSYACTSLMGKMISLALNKFALLDAYGMGVEMDAGKPGWNDAMNGLPGLFGSGMSETFELKRLISFISNNVTGQDKVLIPEEVYEFLIEVYNELQELIRGDIDEFTYWDRVSTIREEYRDRVRFHLVGREVSVETKMIKDIFSLFESKVQKGIHKACDYGDGIVPTYFTFSASEYSPVLDDKGKPVYSHYGLPKVIVKAFDVHPLPHFLEGPAKMLGTLGEDRELAKDLYNRVKQSELYDKKLGMYKTSVPIDDISMENGRIRAFTAGWLERESIFLHMEYKYLLSLLEAGLYDEFYKEIPTAMVVFRDGKEYGRSILENSSFVASSVNPDESLHGRGFVARLSGSTTEALSMWAHMFIGSKMFTYEDGELVLHLEPKLSQWMFDDKGQASFTFLSTCKITYTNLYAKPTYGKEGVKVTRILIVDDGTLIEGNCIGGQLAEKIRSGEIRHIKAELSIDS